MRLRQLLAAAATGLVAIMAIEGSLPLLRDWLRIEYRFEPPTYYDALPADAEANRQEVIALLAWNDKVATASKMQTQEAPQAKPDHGRTLGLPRDFPLSGQYVDPPSSLGDGYRLERDLCHAKWGWGDRWLDLCRDVDRSADAAVHYARDVEEYWAGRLHPAAPPVPVQ